MELKKRSDLHLARKIWHMSGVLLLFLGYALLSFQLFVMFILFLWLLFIPIDLLRQRSEVLNKWAMKIFRPIMRQSEVDRLAGTTYLLTGTLLLVLLFPRDIASLSLLFLSFADPIASYVGIRWGRDKLLGNKSLQGFIAAYVVCSMLVFVYLLSQSLLLDHIVMVSLLSGGIGALAELIPIGKLDDNLTLPLVSGLGLLGLFHLFGFFIVPA